MGGRPDFSPVARALDVKHHTGSVAWEPDPGTAEPGSAVSILPVAARHAPHHRPSDADAPSFLARAVQALAIVGALVLGVASALLLPGTARGADPAPVGAEDTYEAPHSGALTVDAAEGVLANDTGVALVAEAWTEPVFGDLVLAPDGSFSYTRTTLTRDDTFAYLAVDPDGLTTEPVRVVLRFANRTPTCDSLRIDDVAVGASVDVDLADVCTDPDGDAISFAYQRPDVPAGSLWEADASGHVRFAPPLDWVGTGTVVFTADDGLARSMPVTLSLVVREED